MLKRSIPDSTPDFIPLEKESELEPGEIRTYPNKVLIVKNPDCFQRKLQEKDVIIFKLNGIKSDLETKNINLNKILDAKKTDIYELNKEVRFHINKTYRENERTNAETVRANAETARANAESTRAHILEKEINKLRQQIVKLDKYTERLESVVNPEVLRRINHQMIMQVD